MSYLPPSLRARRRSPVMHTPRPAPVIAPADVAAQRLAVCAACDLNSGGNCQLFGCCNKSVAEFVTYAFRQCPAGRWSRWLPPNFNP